MSATYASTRFWPSLAAGLRAALARPGLVVSLWAVHLLLAGAAALPLFRWLLATTGTSPAADALASRFSLALATELFHYTRAPLPAMFMSAALGAMIIGLLASPLLLATTLATLATKPAGEPRAPLATAARLYWPSLRVLILGRGVALVVTLIVGAAMGAGLRPLRESAWEPGAYWAAGLQLGLAALAGLLFLAATDYALVHLVRTETRRAWRACRTGLAMVIRRPLFAASLWIATGILLALALATYMALSGVLGSGTTGWLVAAIVLQQGFVLTRIGLRVGLLAAEQHAFVSPAPAVGELPVSGGFVTGPDPTPVPPHDASAAAVQAPAASVNDEQQPAPGQDREQQV